MKRGSTLFLRITALAMALAVLSLGTVLSVVVYRGWDEEFFDATYMKYPVILGLAVGSVTFAVAVYHALKLLHYIDHNKAFSELSVKALGVIKYCAFIIGVVCAAELPLVYHVAQAADAPGLMVIGLIFAFAPIVIGVFAGVFQRLLQSAIHIKSENDLTV